MLVVVAGSTGSVFESIRGNPDVAVAAASLGWDRPSIEPGRRTVGREVASAVGGEVPLADVSGLVAEGVRALSERVGLWRQCDAVAPTPGPGGAQAGLDGGACGSADRLHGEGLVERDPLRSEGIEAWGNGEPLAEDAARVGALLIREHHEHIGLTPSPHLTGGLRTAPILHCPSLQGSRGPKSETELHSPARNEARRGLPSIVG